MAALAPAPTAEQLLRDLVQLDRLVQAQIAEEQSFRKANSNFSLPGETTQLLLAACEKLVVEKEAMDRAHFEEHTSKVAYLCGHFGTSLHAGLSEHSHREKLAAAHPSASSRRERRSRNLFACCCQMEFPPQQGWWLEVNIHLVPALEVLRAGKITTSLVTELVPGDMLYLQAGQRAPADGRILVHSQAATVDLSDILTDTDELRLCTTEATDSTITSSGNMVLKDTYLVAGSIFCMVVRPPATPLIPTSNPEQEEELRPFTVDVSVPPGMTAAQCRSLFRTLCVRARAACRSFHAMVRLARARSVVLPLTQDLLASGGVQVLGAAVRSLGRMLVIVDCGCKAASLASLAKELSFELVALGGPDGGELASSTPTTCDMCSPSPTGLTTPSDALGLESLVDVQRARLSSLASELVDSKSGGVVLSGMSQAALITMCSLLCDVGSPPLVAMASLCFPAFFKALQHKSCKPLPYAEFTSGPKVSVVPSEYGMQHRVSKAATNDVPPASQNSPAVMADSGPPSRQRNSGACASRVSISSENPSDDTQHRIRTSMASSRISHRTDPAAKLQLYFGRGVSEEPPHLLELFVSVGSIGVISESADCVLMKPDLGCLAQALEIAVRGIPAMALAATEPDV